VASDPMMVRGMGENFWRLKPVAKFVLAGSYRPIIVGTDEGIWERIHLVPFEAKFAANQRVKGLATKLVKAEAPGILGWLIEGLQAWRVRGLEPPARVLQASEKYRQESDTVGLFQRECTVSERGASISQNELWSLYRLWCQQAAENYMLTKHRFMDAIRKRYQTFKSGRDMVRGLRANKS
jgi:putative DNA primase/helicase